jgi:hypothetical protein
MKPAKGARQMGWMDPDGLSDGGDMYWLGKMSVEKLARAFKPTRRLAFERRRSSRYFREYFQRETLDCERGRLILTPELVIKPVDKPRQ